MYHREKAAPAAKRYIDALRIETQSESEFAEEHEVPCFIEPRTGSIDNIIGIVI